ncbi:MAG: lipase/acyltransferase domain-containing protein [Thermoanaerobaculia bacterium]
MSLKPIVFIPGFPASELWRQSPRRMLFPPGLDDIATPKKREKLIEQLCDVTLPPKLVAGQPIRRVMMIAKQAESLYDILRARFGYTTESGDNFRAIGWDWRLGIDDATVQNDIRDKIRELKRATNQNVVVILHSTGGLVFRQLIESDIALQSDIEAILAFGVPWVGTLKALHYLTHGESMGFLTAKLSATQTRKIVRCSQAAYDLCPPDPAGTDFTTPNGTKFKLVENGAHKAIAPLTTTSWMPDDGNLQQLAAAADARLGSRTWTLNANIPLINVAGWGLATQTLCTIRGSDVDYKKTPEGDGTVPFVSATWLRGSRVRTLAVPIGVTITDQIPDTHSQLWNCEPVAQILNEVLRDTAVAPFVHAAVDNDTSRNPHLDVLVRVTASKPDGSPLPGTKVTLHLAQNDNRTATTDDTRLNLSFKRTASMRPNFGSKYFRFRVDVEWTSGRKELPLMIRV